MADKENVLCVDLDGTLVKTDTLWESVIQFTKMNFLAPFLILLWTIRGRAFLKSRLADSIVINPRHLPYEQTLLSYIQEKKQAGYKIWLVSGAHRSIAETVANYLDLFDGVLATENKRSNLSGANKAKKLVQKFGKEGFEYAGNDYIDLHIWRISKNCIVVNAPQKIQKILYQAGKEFKVLGSTKGTLKSWMKAIRPHQWTKNLLIFLPLVASHSIANGGQLLYAIIAFVAFCCLASSTYLINDIFDIEADRRHSVKNIRPFASGELSISKGLFVSLLLFGGAASMALLLPQQFILALLLYAAIAQFYNFFLKRFAIIDVMTLCAFYILRIIAGGHATGTPVSFWLITLSIFFFLSMGYLKRFVEISNTPDLSIVGRNYSFEDRVVIGSLGINSGYIAVLVLILYIESDKIKILYPQPEFVWGVCLVVLYWINRIWLLAYRGKVDHDPILFAIKDKSSYACVSLIVLLTTLAAL